MPPSEEDLHAAYDSGDTGDTSELTEEVMPTEWEWSGEEKTSDTLTVDTVTAVLEEALRLAYKYPASSMFDIFFEISAIRSADCVDWTEKPMENANHFVFSGKDTCDDKASNSFLGMAWGYYGEEMTLDMGTTWSPSIDENNGFRESAKDFIFNGQYLGGQGYIDTRDGYNFSASGSFSWESGGSQLEGYTFESHYLLGSVMWNGQPQTNDQWLGNEINVNWRSRVEYDNTTNKVTHVFLGGGLANLPESGGTVLIEGNEETLGRARYVTSAGGAECLDEATILAEVRTEQGNWAQISFEQEKGCDGCGTLVYDGEELGEVCLDFASILGLESSPW